VEGKEGLCRGSTTEEIEEGRFCKKASEWPGSKIRVLTSVFLKTELIQLRNRHCSALLERKLRRNPEINDVCVQFFHAGFALLKKLLDQTSNKCSKFGEVTIRTNFG